MEEQHIIYFSTRNELARIDLSNVMYFESDSNYTDVRFRGAHHISLLASLTNIDAALNNIGNSTFMRVGRKHIINIKYLSHINLQKSQIILFDSVTSCTYTLSVSMESLKKLKQIISECQVTIIEDFKASNCNMVAFVESKENIHKENEGIHKEE